MLMFQSIESHKAECMHLGADICGSACALVLHVEARGQLQVAFSGAPSTSCEIGPSLAAGTHQLA